MSLHHTLDRKIKALNLIDQHDGDVALASQILELPAATLRDWLANETALRREFRQRQRRQRERLAADLQMRLMERGQTILEQLNDETLAKAPLNQLASALGSLISLALKLEEANEQIDEAEEQVIRHEYFYDGQVQDSPPWAGTRAGEPRAVQGSRLRPEMGQD